jgi:hypothetical protein
VLLGQAPQSASPAAYVGSTTCKPCHPAIYDRWSKKAIRQGLHG